MMPAGEPEVFHRRGPPVAGSRQAARASAGSNARRSTWLCSRARSANLRSPRSRVARRAHAGAVSGSPGDGRKALLLPGIDYGHQVARKTLHQSSRPHVLKTFLIERCAKWTQTRLRSPIATVRIMAPNTSQSGRAFPSAPAGQASCTPPTIPPSTRTVSGQTSRSAVRAEQRRRVRPQARRIRHRGRAAPCAGARPAPARPRIRRGQSGRHARRCRRPPAPRSFVHARRRHLTSRSVIRSNPGGRSSVPSSSSVGGIWSLAVVSCFGIVTIITMRGTLREPMADAPRKSFCARARTRCRSMPMRFARLAGRRSRPRAICAAPRSASFAARSRAGVPADCRLHPGSAALHRGGG